MVGEGISATISGDSTSVSILSFSRVGEVTTGAGVSTSSMIIGGGVSMSSIIIGFGSYSES